MPVAQVVAGFTASSLGRSWRKVFGSPPCPLSVLDPSHVVRFTTRAVQARVDSVERKGPYWARLLTTYARRTGCVSRSGMSGPLGHYITFTWEATDCSCDKKHAWPFASTFAGCYRTVIVFVRSTGFKFFGTIQTPAAPSRTSQVLIPLALKSCPFIIIGCCECR